MDLNMFQGNQLTAGGHRDRKCDLLQEVILSCENYLHYT